VVVGPLLLVTLLGAGGGPAAAHAAPGEAVGTSVGVSTSIAVDASVAVAQPEAVTEIWPVAGDNYSGYDAAMGFAPGTVAAANRGVDPVVGLPLRMPVDADGRPLWDGRWRIQPRSVLPSESVSAVAKRFRRPGGMVATPDPEAGSAPGRPGKRAQAMRGPGSE
jgi:hypothetical protein